MDQEPCINAKNFNTVYAILPYGSDFEPLYPLLRYCLGSTLLRIHWIKNVPLEKTYALILCKNKINLQPKNAKYIFLVRVMLQR